MVLALVAVLAAALVAVGGDAGLVDASPTPEAPAVAVEVRAAGATGKVLDAAAEVRAPSLPLALAGRGGASGQGPGPGPAAAQAEPAGASQGAAPSPAARSVAGVSLAAAAAAAGWTLLRVLGGAPLLPFFSRIEDGELSRHPARRAALDHIAANPGATVREVQAALGLAWGTTVHHLRRLERAGLVAVRRDGGRLGHWPLGQAPPRDGLSGADRAMAGLVKASPGLPQRDLARLSGIGAPAACKRLARLEAAGLVAQVHDGRARLYVPTGQLLALQVPAPAAPLRAVPALPPLLASTPPVAA